VSGLRPVDNEHAGLTGEKLPDRINREAPGRHQFLRREMFFRNEAMRFALVFVLPADVFESLDPAVATSFPLDRLRFPRRELFGMANQFEKIGSELTHA
jgi:hypothetical protein